MATNTSQSSQGTSSSYTYLPQEKLAAYSNLNNFLSNPLQNLNSILAPLFNDPTLLASENNARTNLQDEFRQAGMLGSDIYGNQARQQENNILANRGALATKAGLQYLGPLLSGYSNALQSIPALSNSSSQQSSAGIGYTPQNGSSSLTSSDSLWGSQGPGTTNPYSPFYTGDAFVRGGTGAGNGGGSQVGAGTGTTTDIGNGTGITMPSLQDALNDPGIMNFDYTPQSNSPYDFFGE